MFELLADMSMVLCVAAIPAAFLAAVSEGMEKRYKAKRQARRYYGKYA